MPFTAYALKMYQGQPSGLITRDLSPFSYPSEVSRVYVMPPGAKGGQDINRGCVVLVVFQSKVVRSLEDGEQGIPRRLSMGVVRVEHL